MLGAHHVLWLIGTTMTYDGMTPMYEYRPLTIEWYLSIHTDDLIHTNHPPTHNRRPKDAGA